MRRISVAVVMTVGFLCESACQLGTAQPYQRFVLVPNPSGINKDIPAGCLALDTKTGQLCYTVGGPYTSGFPAIDLCWTVRKANPD